MAEQGKNYNQSVNVFQQALHELPSHNQIRADHAKMKAEHDKMKTVHSHEQANRNHTQKLHS